MADSGASYHVIPSADGMINYQMDNDEVIVRDGRITKVNGKGHIA